MGQTMGLPPVADPIWESPCAKELSFAANSPGLGEKFAPLLKGYRKPIFGKIDRGPSWWSLRNLGEPWWTLVNFMALLHRILLKRLHQNGWSLGDLGGDWRRLRDMG